MMRRILATFAIVAAVPALGAESWIEVKGPAFTVVSSAGEKEARRVLAHFDQVRAVLKGVWPWVKLDPSRPVTVLALRDEADYLRLAPRQASGAPETAGVMLIAPDRNWAAVHSSVTRFSEDDETWQHPYHDVFHQYVHLVLRHNFAQLPPWLEEGLCEFWGHTIVDGDRVYVGRFIPPHVWTLRERPLVPLATLLAIPRGSPEFSDRDRATVYFAEAWGLVHLLSVGSESRQAQLGRLLEQLLSGKPAAEATAEVLGDLTALEREFESYARRGIFPTRRQAAIQDPRAAVVREVPAGESLGLRAAFLSALGRGTEAAPLVAEAIASGSAGASGYEAKALAAWRAQRRDEARQAMEAAVLLPGATDFAHDLLGDLLREAAKDKAGLDRAEGELQRALQMNPGFARAYEGLALVKEAAGAPADQTVPLALRASAIEPGTIDFRLTSLRLMARAGQVAQARSQADRILTWVQGEDRKKVEALVAEISDLKRLPPEAACAAGLGAACGLLGMQYRDGSGVAKDPPKAAGYFQKGCEAGHGGSCSSLGLAYEDGVGVAKDLSRAMALYRKACDHSDRWACTRLAVALVAGDGVPADPAEAVRLLEKSCAAQDVMACAKLGSMLRVGEGVPADLKRAEPLLRGACEKGSSWGCGELASLLLGRGAPAEMQEAARLLEKSCEQDDASFCAMLAQMVELGQGTARDEAKATALYRKACAGGHTPACAKAGAPGR